MKLFSCAWFPSSNTVIIKIHITSSLSIFEEGERKRERVREYHRKHQRRWKELWEELAWEGTYRWHKRMPKRARTTTKPSEIHRFRASLSEENHFLGFRMLEAHKFLERVSIQDNGRSHSKNLRMLWDDDGDDRYVGTRHK